MFRWKDYIELDFISIQDDLVYRLRQGRRSQFWIVSYWVNQIMEFCSLWLKTEMRTSLRNGREHPRNNIATCSASVDGFGDHGDESVASPSWNRDLIKLETRRSKGKSKLMNSSVGHSLSTFCASLILLYDSLNLSIASFSRSSSPSPFSSLTECSLKSGLQYLHSPFSELTRLKPQLMYSSFPNFYGRPPDYLFEEYSLFLSCASWRINECRVVEKETKSSLGSSFQLPRLLFVSPESQFPRDGEIFKIVGQRSVGLMSRVDRVERFCWFKTDLFPPQEERRKTGTSPHKIEFRYLFARFFWDSAFSELSSTLKSRERSWGQSEHRQRATEAPSDRRRGGLNDLVCRYQSPYQVPSPQLRRFHAHASVIDMYISPERLREKGQPRSFHVQTSPRSSVQQKVFSLSEFLACVSLLPSSLSLCYSSILSLSPSPFHPLFSSLFKSSWSFKDQVLDLKMDDAASYGSREGLRPQQPSMRQRNQNSNYQEDGASTKFQPGQPLGYFAARGTPYERKFLSKKLGACCLFLFPLILIPVLVITLVPVLQAVASA